MKKIALGLVAATVGGAMLLSGGSALAQQRTSSVEIKDITPNPVSVKQGGETTAYFKVGASSDVDKVTLRVRLDGQFRTLSEKTVSDRNWRFSVDFNDSDEGRWTAIAEAFKDGKKVAEDTAAFAVEVEDAGKADTRITRFTADPYKVRKGKSIHISGRLQADEDGWEGASGEKVGIYYRANGNSGWKHIGTTTTKWGGKFNASTRAWKSGSFKAVFEGTDELNGSESGSDYVRVYKRWH
ncbi:hypothetical protein [Nonomuraea longicatena]|uniref:Uncharacterized protein n=1 Tax=Nonomuraea longicatena TaxID=83682 RepID=A0ABP4B2Z7_9ACTN